MIKLSPIQQEELDNEFKESVTSSALNDVDLELAYDIKYYIDRKLDYLGQNIHKIIAQIAKNNSNF